MNTRLILAAFTVFIAAPLHAEKHTPLGEQMERFNDAYKALRKVEDAGKAVALTREAQQSVIQSLSEVPALVKEMPDGPAKSKAAAEYRKMMGEVFVTLCEMETLYLEGKTDEAAEKLRGLRSVKKKGHDQFMEDE